MDVSPHTNFSSLPRLHIGVVGGGAIGSWLAGVLRLAGHDVQLLTRGAHLEALSRTPLQLREPDGDRTAPVQATDDPAQLVGAEFALVAVKSYDLASVAPALAVLAHRDSTIVPLLNGVDVVDRLEALGIRRASQLAGSVTVSVARTAPGVVERRSAFQRVVVGEPDGGSSARALLLAGAIAETGIEARASEEIARDLWLKLAFVDPLAAACGLARAPIGAVRDAPGGVDLLERAVREVLAVGRANGVRLTDADARKTIDAVLETPPGMRPSLLADLERGGPTEVDVLCGAVSRLGAAAKVPTPVHDVAATFLGMVSGPVRP